ncbi:MAG TPA: hypothetical protein VFQ43_03610, partial [Nitrososphaera sp.]|nr:hypothetical protein [Nitrososphaera sp.]
DIELAKKHLAHVVIVMLAGMQKNFCYPREIITGMMLTRPDSAGNRRGFNELGTRANYGD